MELVNLTAHVVVVGGDCRWWGVGGRGVRLAPSGRMARVVRAEVGRSVLEVGGRGSVECVGLGSAVSVVGVPESSPGVVWVVSRLVAEVLGPRSDVVFPWGVVRDRWGRVVGCEALGSIVDSEGGSTAVGGV